MEEVAGEGQDVPWTRRSHDWWPDDLCLRSCVAIGHFARISSTGDSNPTGCLHARGQSQSPQFVVFTFISLWDEYCYDYKFCFVWGRFVKRLSMTLSGVSNSRKCFLKVCQMEGKGHHIHWTTKNVSNAYFSNFAIFNIAIINCMYSYFYDIYFRLTFLAIHFVPM